MNHSDIYPMFYKYDKYTFSAADLFTGFKAKDLSVRHVGPGLIEVGYKEPGGLYFCAQNYTYQEALGNLERLYRDHLARPKMKGYTLGKKVSVASADMPEAIRGTITSINDKSITIEIK